MVEGACGTPVYFEAGANAVALGNKAVVYFHYRLAGGYPAVVYAVFHVFAHSEYIGHILEHQLRGIGGNKSEEGEAHQQQQPMGAASGRAGSRHLPQIPFY